MMDLNELRLEIDKIDDQLVKLFAQRMDVSARIGDYKKEHNLPILVPQREEAACAEDYRQWLRAVERSRSWIENEL